MGSARASAAVVSQPASKRSPSHSSCVLADTRTDQYDALGAALLEHHHSGVISLTPAAPGDGEQPLPYGDQIATTTMPIPWVRAAIAVRVNSVIRGHSGVRWIVIEQMRELLNRNLTPLAPLRGSISACGGKALR